MKTSYGRDILKGQVLPFDRETSARVTEQFFTFEKPSKLQFSGDGRRMNHFMLGADPEFMILTGSGGTIHATNLGLKAGLAFGADQNDRLVELRAAPSRDAMKVLASILAELRWLYRFIHPDYKHCGWHAPAFVHGDGLGGHVHFGRKRPQQEDEVQGLDGLARVMRSASLFDSAGWTRRGQGDQFGQLYGQYGDIRLQKHGYEYRTLPTWLDNPRLAYLVLVLSKLVIVDPDITAAWNEPQRGASDWELLQGLAKYYKGRDDDALVLYSMMKDPETFRYIGGDFRLRWGLSGETEPLAMSCVIPAVIEPTSDDFSDVVAHLTEGKTLPMRESAPNFRDSLPKGYVWVPQKIEYRRRPNIGDIFYDMVTHNEQPFTWDFDASGCTIFVPAHFDVTELRKISGDISISNNGSDRFMVRIGVNHRKGAALSHLRSVLYSGLLPIWKVDDVEAESYKKWVDSVMFRPVKKKTYKYASVLKGL